jgi:GDP-L-fucose synthase
MTSPNVIYPLEGKKVFVAGHRGTAGSAIARRLEQEPCEILTATHSELDLMEQADVREWMHENQPDTIVLAAARAGGILPNKDLPADFIYDNLAIQNNVIHAAKEFGVSKLLFLGSSCIYPRLAEQPMVEEALMTGPLEPTNRWYAVAKIAGLMLCQAFRQQFGCDFISAMPSNLYGPGDNFDEKSGHVVAALMLRIHRAKVEGRKSVEIWGTGKPQREYLYVDDLADGLVFLLKHYSSENIINLGTGSDVSISELARKVADAVGFEGEFDYLTSRPDGMPRKVMNVDRMSALGWQAPTSLDRGLADTYQWFLKGQFTKRNHFGLDAATA